MKKKKKKLKRIIALLIILIVGLLILLIINFKIWKYLSKKEITKIEIVDECSLMFENILHNIKDSAGCENSCRSKCYIIKKEYYNSEFLSKNNSCNECTCYCK